MLMLMLMLMRMLMLTRMLQLTLRLTLMLMLLLRRGPFFTEFVLITPFSQALLQGMSAPSTWKWPLYSFASSAAQGHLERHPPWGSIEPATAWLRALRPADRARRAAELQKKALCSQRAQMGWGAGCLEIGAGR